MIDKIEKMFSKISYKFSIIVGSATTFILILLLTLIWLAFGPFVGYSNTWQLLCNTISTIITTLMVVLLQNSQMRESKAIHLKLDELIIKLEGPRNEMAQVDKLSPKELDAIENHLLKETIPANDDPSCENHSPVQQFLASPDSPTTGQHPRV